MEDILLNKQNGIVISTIILNVVIIIASTSYLIYIDALNRGSRSAIMWGIAGAFIPVMFIYISYKSKIGPRSTYATQNERLIGTIWFSAVFAMIVAVGFAPPDPLTQGYYLLYAYPPGLLLGYLLIGKNGWLYRHTP